MSLCSKIPEDVLRTDVENLILNPDLRYEAVCCLLRACCLSAANRRDAGWFFITRGWRRRTGWAGGHNSGWSHHYKLWICLHMSVWAVTEISLKSVARMIRGSALLLSLFLILSCFLWTLSGRRWASWGSLRRAARSPRSLREESRFVLSRVDPISFQLWPHSERCRYHL